jgi:hypothetical protein
LNKLRIRAALLASALSIIASNSHADWKLEVSEDEFSGEKSKRVISASIDRKAALTIEAEWVGTIDAASPSMTMNPGIPYICSTYEHLSLDWMVLDKNGAKLDEDYFTDWEVTTDRKNLFISNYTRAGAPITQSRRLFDAMKLGSELRFQFSDDCGTRSVTKYSLEGFADVVKQLEPLK